MFKVKENIAVALLKRDRSESLKYKIFRIKLLYTKTTNLSHKTLIKEFFLSNLEWLAQFESNLNSIPNQSFSMIACNYFYRLMNILKF